MNEKTRMPVVFFGHGNPMNALERNRYSNAWRAFGTSIPKPKAVLSISAHWYIRATAATAMPNPKTIYDFYGFQQELYEVSYPAPGNAELAATLKELLTPLWVGLDYDTWGLDHGTWSVLVHVFPEADVPVIQLSIDATKPASYHFELGQRLSPLREQGVLILGSGDIVHNLRLVNFGLAQPYDWAIQFDADARRHLREGDNQALIDYHHQPGANLAVPTPDHYLPMLYIAGLRQNDDQYSELVDGIDLASVSMTAFQFA